MKDLRDLEIECITDKAIYLNGEKILDLNDIDQLCDDEDETQSYYIGKDVCPHFDY